MKRALCLIREQLVYRRTAFVKGLRIAGYKVIEGSHLDNPDKDDVLVTWNRYGHGEETAQQFERVGARVIVVENGYMGKTWLGDRWFAAALSQHNGAGTWPIGSGERWDSLHVPLEPWRSGGKERIIIAQRGIGSSEVRSPDGWAEKVKQRIGGRIRAHPGKEDAAVPIENDLENAASVLTWGSSAAIWALMMGVPVWYDFPKWIGAEAALPLKEFYKAGNVLAPVKRSDEDRTAMLRRLIWSMWRAREVEDGSMFMHLLHSQDELVAA